MTEGLTEVQMPGTSKGSRYHKAYYAYPSILKTDSVGAIKSGQLLVEINAFANPYPCVRKESEEKDRQIARLDRLAYPQRYRLSSGAELTHIHVPNYLHPSLHIWTKVGNESFDDVKYGISYETAQRHLRGELTDEEFVNAVFEPQEQVNATQAQLLGTAFMLANGGPAQTHVGTGGGGSQSDLPWGEKKRSGLKR